MSPNEEVTVVHEGEKIVVIIKISKSENMESSAKVSIQPAEPKEYS